jgi:hypothetical protein
LLYGPGMIVYVYMNKKIQLEKRIEKAKKRICLTLLDLFSIIVIESKQGEKHYE